MSTEASDTGVPAPDLLALQENLQQQIDTYDERRLQAKLLPREERVVRSLQSQLADVKQRLAAQRRRTSETAATSNAAANLGSSPGDVPPPATSTGMLNPIESVAGQPVRLPDVIAATLDDGDHAFSNSTRLVLERAANTPIGSTTDGAPVIGPASFLRAVLSIGAEQGTDSSMLAASIASMLSSVDAQLHGRLLTLAPRTPHLTLTGNALANSELTLMLADAVALARQLSGDQTRVDVTHATIAALRTAAGQRVFQELGVLGTVPSTFFVKLADTVVNFLEPQTGFNPQAAQEIRASLALLRLRVGAETTSPSSYVADAPAERLDDDRLGMATDARALAEVVCLRRPGPPLAIGLFGDWGSGKSTFMNMLEAAIEELTERTRHDVTARAALVSNVIHIRFNAWHYNDDNLWASLTSEFFGQLRAGGYGKSATSTYEALVREVLKRVDTLDDQAGVQATDALKAREEAIRSRNKQADLERRRHSVAAEALGMTAKGLVAQADADGLARIEGTLNALGHRIAPVPGTSPTEKPADLDKKRAALADAAAQEIENAATAAGEFSTFARAAANAVFHFSDTPVVAFIGLAIVLVVVVLALPIQWDSLRRTAVAATGFMLLAGTAAGRLYRIVEPIMRAGRDFARQRRTLERDLERQLAEAREQTAAAEQRAREAEQKRTTTAAEAARLRGATPERVFDYYLNLSADTRQFEQQLGTVSRVRRAFEQLNAIYAQQKMLRADATAGKADDGQATGDDSVERIVLYIDDLDRCQFDQVVKVLEAVHLLLAFPLFVVVVGVDARWLQQSLVTFYERQLRGTTTGERHFATVQDYLEKIFQIPIRLAPLADGPPDRFGQYLDAIAGPVESGTLQRDAGSRESRDNVQARKATVLTTVPLRMKPAESAPDTVQRITIRRQELDMMKALAPMLGKSPRAVKRFLNVYRLLRGRRRGEALDAFLVGTKEQPALFAAYQFWLAVDIGLSPTVAAHYDNAFNQDPPFAGLEDVLDAALGKEISVRHAAAIDAVRHSLKRTGYDHHQALAEARREVARFSLPRWNALAPTAPQPAQPSIPHHTSE